jgi:ketosteroid isomerase-like protein
MKKVGNYLIFSGLILGLVSCNDSATTSADVKDTSKMEHKAMFDMDKAKADLETHNQKFATDLKNGDSSALAAYYASDGMVMPPNSDAVVASNIGAMWGGAIRMGMKDLKLTMDDVSGNDEMLAETGQYQMLDGKGNVVDKGKYVVVWKKVNGEWKIFRDIWNTSMPAK